MENLAHEADRLIRELQKYSEALKQDDEQQLHTLLKEGREMKLMTDREDYSRMKSVFHKRIAQLWRTYWRRAIE